MTTYPKRIRREHIRAAIEDLGLDAPVYHHRVVGGRLELHTAAGVFLWPPDEHTAAQDEEGLDDAE